MIQNTTVSHVSPTISYIPGMLWFEGTSDIDSELECYETQSYHATNGTGGQASVSFHWFGVGEVWVFGGYRQRLGSYQVILDGQTTSYSGFRQGDTETYNAVLFSSSGLLPGTHQIELVNTGQDPQHCVLDISSIVFSSSLGDPTTIEDTDPRCSWSPAAGWQATNESHWTFNSVAQMQMNFSGVGFELWGATGPSNSPFSVTLDGWTSQPLTSNTRIAASSNASKLLFFNHNLTDGQHTILIRNDPTWSNASEAPTTLDIDYSTVYGSVDVVVPAVQSVPPAPAHKKDLAVIIGSALGGAIFLVIIFFACFLLHSHFSKIRRKNSLLRPSPFELTAVPQSPDSPGSDLQDDKPSDVEAGGAQLRSQTSISSSVMRALTTLRRWTSRLQKAPPPQKVDHSPSSSLDFDFERFQGRGNLKGKTHLLGDEEIVRTADLSAHSILVNAPSSPLEARTKAGFFQRGHVRSASMESQVLDINYSSTIPSRFHDGDSPLDPSLPSNMHNSIPFFVPILSSPPSKSTLASTRSNPMDPASVTSALGSPSAIVIDPKAAFAAVRDTIVAEESLSPGTRRRTRPLPVPKAIRVNLPVTRGDGKTPPTSQPPPYQLN